MVQKSLTERDLAEAVIAAAEHPTKRKAAEALGVAETTFYRRLQQAQQEEISLESAKSIMSSPIVLAQSQQRVDVIAALRREIKDNHREITALQNLRESVFGLVGTPPTAASWKLGQSKHKSGTEIPVLLMSDFQYGEVIRSEEIDYPNDYNPEIAKKRYRLLIEKTVDIALNYHGAANYSGFVYIRAGDAISGDIHPELAETQALTVNEQVKELVEEELQGIEQLEKQFGTVHIVSIPGNHDRQTIKPRYKRAVDTSFDDLAIWTIELYFKAAGKLNKTIFIDCPRSGDVYLPIFNERLVVTHGDKIGTGGGQGFVGAALPIIRGAHKVKAQYAAMNKMVTEVLMGHYHTHLRIPGTVTANGSLAGYNEFAKNKLRALPRPASQTLLFIDKTHGINTAKEIFVQ